MIEWRWFNLGSNGALTKRGRVSAPQRPGLALTLILMSSGLTE
jgi:hypothetical protein